MKTRFKILLAAAALMILGTTVFLGIQGSYRHKNSQFYDSIVGKMKEGGKIHTLMPDIRHLLTRPFLPTDIRNYANIYGAYIQYKQQKHREAQAFFKNIKFQGDVYDIRDHVYYLWGMNQWKSYQKTKNKKELEQAKNCFKKVKDMADSHLKRKALWYYIKSCYHAGDYSFHDSVPRDFAHEVAKFAPYGPQEFLSIMAKANLAKGNRQKSVDYLLYLWKKRPYSIYAREAEKLLDEMGELKLIQYPSLSAAELLDVLELSYENNKSKTNLEWIKSGLDSIADKVTRQRKDRLNLLYGKVFYRLAGWLGSRRYREASQYYLHQAFRSSNADIKVQSAYYRVKAARSRYQYPLLKQIVSQIDTPKYRQSGYFAGTVYSAGFPFMRKKKYRDAKKIYEIVLKTPREKNKWYDIALWRLHWCNYHLYQYEEALQRLEQLRQNPAWEEYALYWMAYINQRQGKSAEAKSMYRQLLGNSGNTYYGILAEQTLQKDFALSPALKLNKEEFVPLEVRTIEDEKRNKRYKFLKENGLYEFAADELETYLEERNISMDVEKEYWRPYGGELAKVYYYSGRYGKAGKYLYQTYKDYILKGAKNIPAWFWKIYYPVFYKDTIDRYADRYGFSKNFLYAFIRQESYYEPFAVSSAGAIGVMQIMPATARQIKKHYGRELGLTNYSTALLFNPDINIAMGICHLRKHLYDKILQYLQTKNLSDEQKQNILIPLLIAGYNAGRSRAYRWLNETQFDNQQELIDQIDIPETRRYVKLVLKHLRLYQKHKKW